MYQLQINEHSLTYTITYQKRKTIQFKLATTTHLEVIAPNKTTTAAIENLLHTKSKWILTQISRLKNIAENPVNKSLATGAQILYLGQPHTLAITRTLQANLVITLQEHQIAIQLPSTYRFTDVQPFLRKWYIESAARILSYKTSLWANRIEVNPEQIYIKDQKTRWGSCSSCGNIHYNWRIIMAPPEVVDYLVIHELCHLRVPNHSVKFWQEVGRFTPQFKQHRKWLRVNGALLGGIL